MFVILIWNTMNVISQILKTNIVQAGQRLLTAIKNAVEKGWNIWDKDSTSSSEQIVKFWLYLIKLCTPLLKYASIG